jgi:hypothetical protein
VFSSSANCLYSRQCLEKRKIPDLGTLRRETRVWNWHINRAGTNGPVMNQDETVNSQTNPAKTGSVVTFYATGWQGRYARRFR